MNKDNKMVVLRAVVTGWIIAEKAFTSVELCNHMKRLGIWIRNREVAEFLRENVESIASEYGVYSDKTLISVDVKNKFGATAYLYHVVGYDHTVYNGRDLKAITPEEFEAMHGISAFEDTDDGKPVATVDKSGEIKFNFPSPK